MRKKSKMPPDIAKLIREIEELPKGQLHPKQIEMLEEAVKAKRLDFIFGGAIQCGDDDTAMYIAENLCENLNLQNQLLCASLLKQKGKVH